MGGACSGPNQSPINLSQSTTEPCDTLCDLVFDDAYIPQANLVVSDEGVVLMSDTGLGSCKFNGEGYTCKGLLVNHPSHHTIENIQADAEVIAFFNSPTGKLLCVSSLVRVNPQQTTSSAFFNAFVPYVNSSSQYTSVSLNDWGLFKMVPPNGAYFVYDGSSVIPPCQNATWIVFRSMINIDPNDFALLTKNVSPGSRPLQSLGDRVVYYNDSEHLPGGPMPRDGKLYIRFKKPKRKEGEVKPVQKPDVSGAAASEKGKKKNAVHQWVSDQVAQNGIMALIDVVLMIVSIGYGIYYAWQFSKGTSGFYLVLLAQRLAVWIKSFFQKKSAPVYTSATPQ